jgi:hypothetical protein
MLLCALSTAQGVWVPFFPRRVRNLSRVSDGRGVDFAGAWVPPERCRICPVISYAVLALWGHFSL